MAKIPTIIPVVLIVSACVGCTFSKVMTRHSTQPLTAAAPEPMEMTSGQPIVERACQPVENRSPVLGGAVELVDLDTAKNGFREAIPSAFEHELEIITEIEPIPLVDSPNDTTEARFTLERLIDRALANNASIQQAEAAVCKAQGTRIQVGLKPNPAIGYFGEEIGVDGAGGLHGLYVSQTFVRGDKLNWNQHVVSHDVNQLMWQLQTQRRRVETDVKIQFYRVLTAQRKLAQSREFRKNAEKAVEIARQRLASEDGTKPDLLQSEILLDQIDLSIQAAEIDLDASWSELAAIVGDPTMPRTELMGELTVESHREPDAMWAELESSSPLLMAALARIDRARVNIQRQSNQVVPNINGQIAAGYDDGSGNAFSSVQVQMPIPYSNQNQGNLSAAHAEYHLSLRNLERLRMLMRKNLASATRRFEQSQATAMKFESLILPKSKESLELVERAYLAGEVEFLRVLNSRQNYFQLTQQFIDAQGQLAQIDAEIDGLLLTGGLENGVTYTADDGLRGQALSGQ